MKINSPFKLVLFTILLFSGLATCQREYKTPSNLSKIVLKEGEIRVKKEFVETTYSQTEIEYDILGNKIWEKIKNDHRPDRDVIRRFENTYDSLNRLTETIHFENDNMYLTVKKTYDQRGNLFEENRIYPPGKHSLQLKTIHEYDEKNRLRLSKHLSVSDLKKDTTSNARIYTFKTSGDTLIKTQEYKSWYRPIHLENISCYLDTFLVKSIKNNATTLFYYDEKGKLEKRTSPYSMKNFSDLNSMEKGIRTTFFEYSKNKEIRKSYFGKEQLIYHSEKTFYDNGKLKTYEVFIDNGGGCFTDEGTKESYKYEYF